MPMVGMLRVTGTSPSSTATSTAPARSSPTNLSPAASNAPGSKPDDIPLWLPSSLPIPLASHASIASLRDKERRLRLAQLSDTLDDITCSHHFLNKHLHYWPARMCIMSFICAGSFINAKKQ